MCTTHIHIYTLKPKQRKHGYETESGRWLKNATPFGYVCIEGNRFIQVSPCVSREFNKQTLLMILNSLEQPKQVKIHFSNLNNYFCQNHNMQTYKWVICRVLFLNIIRLLYTTNKYTVCLKTVWLEWKIYNKGYKQQSPESPSVILSFWYYLRVHTHTHTHTHLHTHTHTQIT